MAFMAATPGAAWAQSVSLQGMLGSKALLIIDGGAPKVLSPGQSSQGVKLVSVSAADSLAVVEFDGGQRHTLRVGASPAHVGGAAAGQGAASGSRVVLTADGQGHFFSQGSINNKPVQFLIDTGASLITLGQAEADQIGLDYKTGRLVGIATANGSAKAYMTKIDQVRIGDVSVYNVDAVIAEHAMPAVLLGNSFLTRFNMQRTGDQMTLTKR
ncbi:MAG: TIGR02281 family clan AA aspartic protease [Burkholderiaceae bacterium]|nr:TIGR02281 family clan AA aspartic protease [Burkholderiaceae bacterium]